MSGSFHVTLSSSGSVILEENFFQLHYPIFAGPWFEQLKSTLSKCFHVNISSFGSVVLEKKIFKWPHPILQHRDYLPFEEDMALYSNNFEFPLPKDDLFDWNWPAWSGEDFVFNLNSCKYGFPYRGPSRPPGTMIWTNWNLHYIRMLSCKYELFWLSGSWEDF
jgi:hypothetical protein